MSPTFKYLLLSRFGCRQALLYRGAIKSVCRLLLQPKSCPDFLHPLALPVSDSKELGRVRQSNPLDFSHSQVEFCKLGYVYCLFISHYLSSYRKESSDANNMLPLCINPAYPHLLSLAFLHAYVSLLSRLALFRRHARHYGNRA